MTIEIREYIALSDEEKDALITVKNTLLEGSNRGSDPYFRQICVDVLNKLEVFEEYLDD